MDQVIIYRVFLPHFSDIILLKFNKGIMDICIGGPWHAGKILRGNSKYGNSFKAKDKSGCLVTYKKNKVVIDGKSRIFWISSSLTDEQIPILLQEVLWKYRDGT